MHHAKISTKKPPSSPLKEAQEAVDKLCDLQPLLSPRDEETLALLIDKKFMAHLRKSMKEAEAGNFDSLETILK